MFLNSNNFLILFIIFVYNVSSSPLKMLISEKSEANLKQILGLYDIDIDTNRIEQLFPISETELDINSELSGKETSEKDHVRQKRATCDVLSFQSKWISLNHSACAVHCLTKKKKGGRCKDGICICRNK